MRILVIFLSLYAFFKTIAYGIFEYKNNSNKIGGVIVILMGCLALIVPTFIYYINFI